MAKNWQHAAGIVWPILTCAAEERETLTYGEIAPHIATNPLNVGKALGPIQDYCIENRLPPLTVIVIGAQSEQPGSGFIAWDIDDLDTAYRQVFDYPWSATPNPYSAFGPDDTEETFAQQIIDDLDTAGEIYSLVRVRGIVQRIFKDAILKAYDDQCAFCGFSFVEGLQGCHIKPWDKSSRSERIDPRNGLLLCATHHCLFDKGVITVSRSFSVVFSDPGMVSGIYSKADQALTVSLHGKKILLPAARRFWPNPEFLRARHEIHEWGDLP